MNTCVRDFSNQHGNQNHRNIYGMSHECKKIAMKNYLKDVQTFEADFLSNYLNNYV